MTLAAPAPQRLFDGEADLLALGEVRARAAGHVHVTDDIDLSSRRPTVSPAFMNRAGSP